MNALYPGAEREAGPMTGFSGFMAEPPKLTPEQEFALQRQSEEDALIQGIQQLIAGKGQAAQGNLATIGGLSAGAGLNKAGLLPDVPGMLRSGLESGYEGVKSGARKVIESFTSGGSLSRGTASAAAAAPAAAEAGQSALGKTAEAFGETVSQVAGPVAGVVGPAAALGTAGYGVSKGLSAGKDIGESLASIQDRATRGKLTEEYGQKSALHSGAAGLSGAMTGALLGGPLTAGLGALAAAPQIAEMVQALGPVEASRQLDPAYHAGGRSGQNAALAATMTGIPGLSSFGSASSFLRGAGRLGKKLKDAF